MGQRLITNVEASTIAATATCGTSAVITLPTSAGDAHLIGGKLVVNVVHSTINTPLHLQLRSTFVDANGASNAVPVTQYLNSNDETYGNSAQVPNSLILLKSGQNAQVAIENVVGNGLQVVIMAASTTATSAVSAQIAVWKVG
jgi:hypothetical protein